jgi:hypothetical protein
VSEIFYASVAEVGIKVGWPVRITGQIIRFVSKP